MKRYNPRRVTADACYAQAHDDVFDQNNLSPHQLRTVLRWQQPENFNQPVQ